MILFRLCRDIRYQFTNNQVGFTFEFLRNQTDSINDSINGSIKDLNAAEKELLRLILTERSNTKQGFAEAIGKSTSTVQRYLNHLSNPGLIRREGAKKRSMDFRVEQYGLVGNTWIIGNGELFSHIAK